MILAMLCVYWLAIKKIPINKGIYYFQDNLPKTGKEPNEFEKYKQITMKLVYTWNPPFVGFLNQIISGFQFLLSYFATYL